MKKIHQECFKFIWNGKRDKIKRSVLVKKVEEGGLRMTDINDFEKSLKLTWINRMLHHSNIWRTLRPSHINFQLMIKTGGYIDTKKWRKQQTAFGGSSMRLGINLYVRYTSAQK